MLRLKKISSFVRSEKVLVTADQVLVSAVSFLSTLLMAKALPIKLFSTYASVVFIALLLLTLQQALITAPWVVLQAQLPPQQKQPYRVTTTALQIIFIMLLTLLSVIFFYGRPGFLQPLYGGWWATTLFLLTYLCQDYLRRILIAEGNTGQAFVMDAISLLPQLLILFLLYRYRSLSVSTGFMVCGYTTLPALAYGIYKQRDMQPGKFFSAALLRAHMRQAKWLLYTAILQWWAGNAFIVNAGLILGAGAFAALRLVQNFMGFINVLFLAFESYVLPKAAQHYALSARKGIQYIRQAAIKAGFVVLPLLLLIAVLAKRLLGILGGTAFSPYAIVLQGMAVLYVFVYIGYPVRILIKVSLLNKHFFIGYLLTAVFSLICAQAFVRNWALPGVIAGLVINQLLVLSYWTFILAKKKSAVWK